jgi:selenide, water dikinase
VRNLPKFTDPNLIVGAEDFSDAGVYRLRDDLYIVQTLDFFPPLVDDPYLFGRIAAANSLSDVFAMGGRPVTAMNIVGFPDDQLELEIFGEILRGGAERVMAAGAVIVGGHTVRDVEIKYGLSVTGVATPETLLTNKGAKPGDTLVLTKALGTGFVTTAFKAGKCPPDVLEVATASMAGLNRAAAEAAQATGAHASTDITGFGLIGHTAEVAQASRVTITLELSKLPILPGALDLVRAGYKTRASNSNRAFAEATTRLAPGLDPLRVEIAFDAQTSGGLLISVSPERADELVERAKTGGAVAATIIGNVEPLGTHAVVVRT